MRYLLCLLVSIPLLLFSQVTRPVATNISGVVDYSTELVFTDAFKMCREWTTFDAEGSGPWDTGADVPMLDNGFPVEVPFDGGTGKPQKVRALMVWDIDTARPEGKYRLIVKGKGKVGLQFGADGIFDCPVDTLVDVYGNVSLSIEYSDKDDPIRDIRFIYPRYVHSFESQTFHDDFLDFLKDFQCIRFMDWLRTNNSNVVSWSDRSAYNFYTQTLESGVAYEYITELSNLMHKDPWICIPHRADDDYIRQLASFLKTHLDPGLKIYLEYSNEVWNGGFWQHSEAAALAAAAGYTGTEWERAWKWTAKRSADLFTIFEDEFGGNKRLYKIIPSQAANSWLSNQIITYFEDPQYNPGGVRADALAIAPYFGGEVAQDVVAEGIVSSITVEEIVDRMEASLPVSFQWMLESKQVAGDHGLELITYEGGQHLVGTGGNENIEELTEKLIAANHHPDLQDVYCQYFDYWYENAGGLFAHFSSHGGYSKWGSWGIKENFADVNNPKYLAIRSCVFEHNDTNSSYNEIEDDASLILYPNPSAAGYFYLKGNIDNADLRITDLMGRPQSYMIESASPGLMKIRTSTKGLLLVQVTKSGKTINLKHIQL